METTVNKQLILFMKANRIQRKKIAESMGITENALNLKLQGIRGIEVNLVQNVLLAYPNLSAEWLLRGNGEMMKVENNSTINNNLEQDLRYIIDLQKDKIANLELQLDLAQKEKTSAYSRTAQTA